METFREIGMTSAVEQKRLIIAYHETGHAVMALWCNRAVQKISLKEMRWTHQVDQINILAI